MLPTPHTKPWEIGLDVFVMQARPCRIFQERIVDYLMDGKPMFEWEKMRKRHVFSGHTRILDVCEPCFLNVFGGMEGCKGLILDLDIFFRCLSELVPHSPWNDVDQEGEPSDPDHTKILATDLEHLREILAGKEWPVALRRFSGEPVLSESFDKEQEGDRRQFFAWNGEGPPFLISHNEGYQIYMSRHGFLVKPTHGSMIPHAFKKLWREETGAFGLSSAGETVAFQITRSHYPTWSNEDLPGNELSLETLPASEALRGLLDVLDVFSTVAAQFDIGFWIRRLKDLT